MRILGGVHDSPILNPNQRQKTRETRGQKQGTRVQAEKKQGAKEKSKRQRTPVLCPPSSEEYAKLTLMFAHEFDSKKTGLHVDRDHARQLGTVVFKGAPTPSQATFAD